MLTWVTWPPWPMGRARGCCTTQCNLEGPEQLRRHKPNATFNTSNGSLASSRGAVRNGLQAVQGHAGQFLSATLDLQSLQVESSPYLGWPSPTAK